MGLCDQKHFPRPPLEGCAKTFIGQRTRANKDIEFASLGRQKRKPKNKCGEGVV
jgi:hypothetical protein